ncbi:hypothetical protein [Rhodopirellula europaea]|uniref:Uncharacterized protein n=1 Tax=Rhodopirellula europaea SH398 TaxID=1263868 RepID=M5SA90_9BACT|nr:hypothetical protein [Rhodopirellula europaea]EMI24582.1 hypothetical protein RESH_04953 [Rhodopirellula europaea SH398]
MRKTTKTSKRSGQQVDDDRAKRVNARKQLRAWLTRFGKDEITLQTEEDVKQQASHLVSLVRETHSRSSSAAHRRFKEIAAAVDDQIGLIDQSEKHMKMLFERLIRAADAEVDFKCPWDHLLMELERKPRQLTVARALWDANKDLSAEWTIPLGDFVYKVWGCDFIKTSKIRPVICKLAKFINERGVGLKIEVHDSEGVHRIDCKLT